MNILTAVLSLAALSTAAADFSTSPISPLQQLSDDPPCLPFEIPCFHGCLDATKLRCCAHPARPEPWSCPSDWECGGAPKFGCYDYSSSAATTTTTKTTRPPLTFTASPTFIPHPGGPDFNPTIIVPVPPDLPRKTPDGTGENVLSFVGKPTPISLSSTLVGRETCFFVAAVERGDAAGGTSDGACPPSVVSSAPASGSGVRFRAGLWGTAAVVGGAVLLLHRLV